MIYLSEEETEKQRLYDDAYPSEYALEEYPILDGKKHPFALIVPGGGYYCVCSFVEGLPYAKNLNALGYAAFILRYRTKDKAHFPNPQDDLARALKDILSRAEELGIDPDHYSVWGSSAGGHLAASFGTESMGYRRYGLPKPDCMILCYPVITMGPLSHPGTKDLLIGLDAPKEEYVKYSVEEQVTKAFPPTYLFHGLADGAVPYQNSLMLAERLNAVGVDCELRLYSNVEHGTGLARDLLCCDWFDGAIAFWRRNFLLAK